MGIAAKVRKINPLIDGWSKADWIFYFVAVPVLLLAVFFLPSSIKQYLILQMQAPTILSIFANHYTHTDPMHLIGNLSVYIVLVFLIFNLETDKKRFHTMSVFFFIIVPLVVSLILIRFLSILPPTQGFSAIDAAIMGYLIYSAYTYLRARYNFIKPNILAISIFANMALLTIFNGYGLGIISVCLIGLFAFLFIEFRNIVSLSRELFKSYKSISRKAFFELVYKTTIFLFTGCLMFALPTLVPFNIVEGSAIINSAAHYIGWLLGLFVPVILEQRHVRIKL